MMSPLRLLIMNRKYDRTIGGVEKMSVLLANQMAARGHECHVVSLDQPSAEMYFPIDPRVKWHRVAQEDASAKASWSERLRRLFSIRKIIRENRIDVAIGFQDGAYLSVMSAAFGTKARIIAAERNSPSRFDFLTDKKMRSVVFNSFRLADAVTVQCPSYKEMYPAYLYEKIHVIPNPIQPAKETAEPANGSNMLFVGRLDWQKNLETLIKAFAIAGRVFPDWRLTIVGGGIQEDKLRQLAKDLSVTNRVVFSGPVSDVHGQYKNAHIFCLPSLFEGFPNALAEAMAHGLPSIGFRRCAGVRDMIEDGVTGYLADGDFSDEESLAKAMMALMEDKDRRTKMGLAAVEMSKRYKIDDIMDQWETLFRSLLRPSG